MPLNFSPPLLNSASPWATTKADLEALYDSPSTGAVTTRTSLILGWKHDEAIHNYTFLESRSGNVKAKDSPDADSSLNTLGYSPIDLAAYLEIIEGIVTSRRSEGPKPFIISVTGAPHEIAECYALIAEHSSKLEHRLLMEINLSCPNIANKPPPAYSYAALAEYLGEVTQAIKRSPHPKVDVGIKAPPFTYNDQFNSVVEALLDITRMNGACPIVYIASTNTLGNCLVTARDSTKLPALASESGEGLGGLGGASIHALSLGNVMKFRTMLDKHPELQQVEIIGIGGVLSSVAFHRMKDAGAAAVAVGTGLGLRGVKIFEQIV